MLQLDVERLILDGTTTSVIVIVVVVDFIGHLRGFKFFLIEQATLDQFLNRVLVAQNTEALTVHVGIDFNLV